LLFFPVAVLLKGKRSSTSELCSSIRAELDETRLQVKKLTETKKEEKKRLADEDATRYYPPPLMRFRELFLNVRLFCVCEKEIEVKNIENSYGFQTL
jgi:hypothetical protein